MSRWLPALRIARRSVLRSPARSLLIAILVGLPVAGATYVDVIARTFSSPERDAQRAVGSADGAITVTAGKRLPEGNNPRWLVEQSSPRRQRDPAKVDVAGLLPAGSRLVAMPRYQDVVLQRGERIVRTRIVVGDVREPLHRFALRLEDSSRAPRDDEVLVTRKLAERLKLLHDGDRLRPGAAIRLLDGPTARVAGLVRDPACLSCEQVAAPPGSAVVRETSGGRAGDTSYGYGTNDPTYLVDLPVGVSEDALGRRLAARGIALTTREALAHPERYPSRDGDGGGGDGDVNADALRAAALVALIVALGLLEVVLLAGTAFAVGARRQVRELGLVAASGGSGRDIRRIVLAQGLVLGALGAALGVAAGFAIAIAGRPLWERLADGEIAGWAFGPAEIAGAALVGLLSGLAAAVVPAVGASRMRPVNALAGRFRAGPGARRRSTLIGAGLVVIGAGCGLLGDRLLADDFAAYERALAGVQRGGGYVSAPSPDGPLALVIGGATFAVVGLVLLAPALIGWIARFGARLPLSARLAVRDAERHRHRTGPATGAIVVAVTGSVVLAFLLAGQFRADELRHVPSLPPNTFAVERGDGSTKMMLRGAELAVEELPQARRHTLTVPLGPLAPDVEPALGQSQDGVRAISVLQRDGGCAADLSDYDCGLIEVGLAIGGDDAVTRLVAGAGFDGAARDALADGKVLVFDDTMLDRAGGVRVSQSDGDELRLPGHLVERERAYRILPSALVSAPTARARGWDVRSGSVLVTYGDRASRDQLDAALTAADRVGAIAIEDSGPDNPENLAMALIAAAAAFITLVGVAISVALSAAEGRADLATLAAVGAPPGRRRALMASQALLVGGLGCVLGVGLGTFVAFTARATTGSPELVVPWGNVAATAIGVPLLAGIVAALCTRSRLPIVRRAE